MTRRNVSAGVAIAKVFRDLDVDSEHWIVDGIEWMAEAIEFIGCVEAYVHKGVLLEVYNYNAQLPIDYMVPTGFFFAGEDATVDDFKDLAKLPLEISEGTLHHATHPELATSGVFPNSNDVSYQINDGYIYTSFEQGVMGFTYYAMPLDSEGWPRIPDHVSVMEAIFWYIVQKMMLKGFKHPDSNINYMFAHQQWLKYCTQARGALAMPDIPRMQNFMKHWVKQAQTHDRFLSAFNDGPTSIIGTYGSEAFAENRVA